MALPEVKTKTVGVKRSKESQESEANEESDDIDHETVEPKKTRRKVHLENEETKEKAKQDKISVQKLENPESECPMKSDLLEEENKISAN